MEIDEMLKLLAVKVNCKDERGSGVLVQPETNEYSYVITARHCIEGHGEVPQRYEPKDIIIERTIQGGNQVLVGIDCYFHHNKDIDLAIVKIPYLADLIPLYVSRAKYGDSCAIYGYPGLLSDEPNERDIVYGKVSDSGSTDGRIEIKMNARQETTGSRTSNNIQGFSGSGIFGEKEVIELYGVFSELKDENSVYNTYCGFNVRCIEEIVEERKIAKLVHYKLTTFEGFLDTAFEAYRKEIATVLKMRFKKEITLTPKNIITQIGGRLAIPYDKECILVDNLWEGWVKLVVLLHIIGIDISYVDQMHYEKDGIRNHIRMIYSGEYKRSEEIIYEIFKNKDILDEMINNGIIIMNTKNTFHGKILNRERIKNIIGNIDSCIRFENGIDISDPNYSKNLSIIHMDKFGDSFEEDITDNIDCYLVEEDIKKIVRGVLDNAIK